ncbi:MAG: hypothetical protein OSA99_17385 [Acidimicrobiales bacterium]|nr:hypothetical protein [Acidimicrobiales bacterium]
MLALISLFIIVLASLLVTRVAATMLTLTGLSAQSARFQARSAFSGAGFTTSESEAITSHPVRRRVISTLMLLGNAGIVSGVASLLLSFAGTDSTQQALLEIVAILVFLIVLIRLARSEAVNRGLSRVIERALRRFTEIDVRDYAGLLHLQEDWIIGEMVIDEDDWFCNRTIDDLHLADEGVMVLGIERSGHRWVGAPSSSTKFHANDVVILYGLQETIERIDARERTADGELDWVTSQIEFTERYLEQQERERSMDDPDNAETTEDEPMGSHLHAGERTDDHGDVA